VELAALKIVLPATSTITPDDISNNLLD